MLWGRGAHPHPPPHTTNPPPHIPKAPFPLYESPQYILKGMKPISMGQTTQMGVPAALWGRGAHPQPPSPPPHPQSPFSPLWIPTAHLKGDEAHFYGANHADGGP